MIAQQQRDARGRFAAGNTIAAAGGLARAQKLSKRRRKAIARKGYRIMVARHFGGDQQCQRSYLAELGRYAYESMAGTYTPGSPLRTPTRHPGTIQEFRARFYQLDLMWGSHRDVEFMERK
jgi:hypothetical protein